MTVGFEVRAMKHERQEQTIFFDKHSPKGVKRLALSILLLKEGINPQIVSRVVGVSPRQVHNYRKIHDEKGTAAFTDIRYRPVSELEAYKDIIKEDLLARPVATSAEASERIHELTGIKRSPTQIRHCLHRLGLKPLKVAAIPAKANPIAQSDFLQQSLEPRIIEAEKGERVLLFMDAAHFVWQLYLGVLWCLSRIFIPAASGRTRINVLGAYDPIKNVLIKIVNRSYINSSTVIELLEKIRTVYCDNAISIVLDNAKYQRCKVVMAKAAALHIELLFLPTYSPNLNLIERLWRFVKKECLYSKYYETANDFESAIVSCLDDINIGKKQKLKKLMTLKFQLFSLPSSEYGVTTKVAA
jgi:transposase